MPQRIYWTAILLSVALLAALGTLRQTEVRGDIVGVVTDGSRSLQGATVRLKNSKVQAITDVEGRFVLRDVAVSGTGRVTAWLGGYYIGGTEASVGRADALIVLEKYETLDAPGYQWVPPAVDRPMLEELVTNMGLSLAARASFDRALLPLAERMELGCRDCHGEVIFRQWSESAHARGASNERFRTVYYGSDVNGNFGEPTRYALHPDYGPIPLLPELSQPYFGPGFKLDFPDAAGNCSTCHLPSAALSAPDGIEPAMVSGVEATGTHCDYCHKMANVKLEPDTGLPPENMPGILSTVLRRPSPRKQLFFGPYDDVDVGPDSFLPLQRKSEFCAPCHNASFWGTPVYQSFGEWRASPYNSSDGGKTCQDCHMAPDGVTRNFASGRGGLDRDPGEIFTHSFSIDEKLLKNTATLELAVSREGERVAVRVRVTNREAGHHVPTDHPMRNMILLVRASDGRDRELTLIDGPTLPDWAGKGLAADDYAGRPGRGFAKVLENLWTEESPSISYWRQTIVREDTRLAALATDVSRYTFVAPSDHAVIEATLIFRRAFKELAATKGWDLKDIVMASTKAYVN